MGSDIVYENRVYNHTFEPFVTPIVFLISIACLSLSILFYLHTRKKLKPVPEVSQKKKEISTTVKSDSGITAQYSDEHLIVTSNMQERLKMFESQKKIIK